MQRPAEFDRRVLLLVLAVGGGFAAGCGDDSSVSDATDVEVGADADVDADAGTDADAEADGGALVRVRACTTTFEYRPVGTATEVRLVGEWDWATPVPMRRESDHWVVERELAPGLYCYKLVVDGEWRYDPENPYLAFCGGVENSGRRVPDRTLPLLRAEGVPVAGAGSFEVRIAFDAGCGGSGPAVVRAVRTHDFEETTAAVVLDPATWTATVSLTGLAAGKHTVRIEAEDLDGRSAEPLRFPFWVEAEPFAWSDALIYMVMTDRFADGDPSNNGGPTPGAEPTADRHGGDLAGVTAAIEAGEFDALGVRALWFSPFNTNPDGGEPAQDGVHLVTGYHGYWPVEPRQVDPRLGGDRALRELVRAAHGHGIRVLMDLVVNHVHEDHPYYRDHPEWFNSGCICGTAGCDWTAERLTCLFTSYMPDIDWRNREASEQFLADAEWWLEAFDLDGFRIDAVKHVDDLAVRNLAVRVVEGFETAGTDYYLDGETAMGWAGDRLEDNLPEYAAISRSIGPWGLDGQFDFVLYHAVAYRVFARGERGLLHLDYWTEQSQLQYPAGAVMTPFVGSHDSPRLVSLADYRGQDAAHAVEVAYRQWPSQGLPEAPGDDEPYERARTAFCWLLTIPGAPLLYMGDEYGEYGGGDPDNRHDHRSGAELTPRESALRAEVAVLGRLRQEVPALRRGSYRSLGGTETTVSYVRDAGTEGAALVVLNAAGTPAVHSVELAGTPLAGSSSLVERTGFGATVVADGGRAAVTVPGRSCAVFTAP